MSDNYRRKWLWIVLDGATPTRVYSEVAGAQASTYAQAFGTWQEAYEVKQKIYRRFCDHANKAPSLESDQFKFWNGRIHGLKIVRVKVEGFAA